MFTYERANIVDLTTRMVERKRDLKDKMREVINWYKKSSFDNRHTINRDLMKGLRRVYLIDNDSQLYSSLLEIKSFSIADKAKLLAAFEIDNPIKKLSPTLFDKIDLFRASYEKVADVKRIIELEDLTKVREMQAIIDQKNSEIISLRDMIENLIKDNAKFREENKRLAQGGRRYSDKYDIQELRNELGEEGEEEKKLEAPRLFR